MSNKHILIITNLYPNPIEPVRAVFLPQLTAKLKQYFDVDVFSPLPWLPKLRLFRKFTRWYKFSQVPYQAQMNGQLVIYPKYLVIPKVLGFLQSVTLFLSLYKKVCKMHREKKIDLINSHWVFPDGIAAVWISRILKIPVVVSAHGCDINLYTTFRFRRPQIKSALKHSDKVTAICRTQKQVITSMGIDAAKVRVIGNGVNNKKFKITSRRECRRRLGLQQETNIILFIGRLEEEKGLEYLIRAVEKLEKEIQARTKIAIIGDGTLRKPLENEIIRRGLADNFTFYGEREYNEIPLWFGASDLFCLPSKREGCPNVVLEALASGIPVIASRVGAIPEVVNENSGILFEAGDVHKLAESLENALKQDWQREKIRQSISHMSWDKTAEVYFQVFSKLISQKEA
jgi:glycosyltransferase involved in cell wall biosynthesis